METINFNGKLLAISEIKKSLQVNTKATEPDFKKIVQAWYDAANWIGYADTPLGRIHEYYILKLARICGIVLEYSSYS